MQLRRNTLLLSRGDGTFAETARQAGLEATDWSWCPIFLDVDLDGWEDLLVVNGHLMDALDSDVMERRQRLPDGSPEKKQVRYPPLMTPNVAFRNGGDLNFTSVGEQWGFDSQRISNGFCMGDLDFDGDLFVAQNWESTPDHIGRLDAGQGLILQGKPDGSFEPLSAEASGIRIDAEQQGAWVGDANGDQRPDLWIQHSAAIQLYLNQREL